MAWPPVAVAAARFAADATAAGVVATGAWALEWERAKLGFGNAAKLTSYHEAAGIFIHDGGLLNHALKDFHGKGCILKASGCLSRNYVRNTMSHNLKGAQLRSERSPSKRLISMSC